MSKEKLLKATYGSDKTKLKLGNIEIPCYVLGDGTRVFSGRGIQRALGSTATSGTWLTKFVNESPITKHLKTGILEQLNNPIKFQRPAAGGSQSATYGYEATVLIDICDSILESNKTGEKIEKHIVDNAQLIIRSVAKVGIIALIDEITGYQYDREAKELQTILSAYISEELLAWQQRFPHEFYKEIFRLRGWDYTAANIKTKPSVVGHWTNTLVYNQLPKGVIQELKKLTPKDDKGNRKHHYHRLLTQDVGHPHLQKQIVSVVTLMSVSDNWKDFIKLFNKKFGQQELEFGENQDVRQIPDDRKLSVFNKDLKKALEYNPKEEK